MDNLLPIISSKPSRGNFPGLEHLFGSRTRARLLSIFLHSPERRFFVRELAREIGAQINSVRRELANLEGIKLLISEEVQEDASKGSAGRRKYYQVVKESILFHELRSVVRKSEMFLERNLLDELKNIGEFDYVALTGDFLGQADFPVDLFLVGTTDHEKLKAFIKDLEKSLGWEVDYALFSREEYATRLDLADRFLYRVLEVEKTVLVDKLDVRKQTNNL